MNKRQKKKNKETLILFGSKRIYIPGAGYTEKAENTPVFCTHLKRRIVNDMLVTKAETYQGVFNVSEEGDGQHYNVRPERRKRNLWKVILSS